MLKLLEAIVIYLFGFMILDYNLNRYGVRERIALVASIIFGAICFLVYWGVAFNVLS